MEKIFSVPSIFFISFHFRLCVCVCVFIAIADAICRWMRGISFVNAKQKPFHVLRHTSLAIFFRVSFYFIFSLEISCLWLFFCIWRACNSRSCWLFSIPWISITKSGRGENQHTNRMCLQHTHTHTHSAALQHSAIKIELTTTEYLHIRA